MANGARSLHIRVPIFDPARGAVADAVWAWRLWWEANGPRILRDFEFTDRSVNTVTPLRKFTLTGGVTVEYPKDKKAAVPKGLNIRLELLAILDSVPPETRHQSYFVHIDGSGAIDFSGIELVLKELIRNDKDVALGRRPEDHPDWFMGNPDRKTVELFENFLLERRYQEEVTRQFGGDLPDAQAGCWGLKLGVLKHIGLTAQEYGLEFDVAASALAARLSIGFTDNLTPGQRTSSAFGGFQTSIRKLRFILHKLDFTKSDLRTNLEEYEALFVNDRDRKLPQIYKEMVKEFIAS